MARAVYSYELDDPDFNWLLMHFELSHPNYIMVQEDALPIVLIKCESEDLSLEEEQSETLLLDRPANGARQK